MGFLDKLISKKPEPAPFDFGVIKWGTLAPVVVKLAGKLTQIRAFGTIQFQPKDPVQFLGLFGEPPNREKLAELTQNLKNIVAQKCTDVIGELSADTPDAQSIISRKDEVAASIQGQLSEDLNKLGLDVKSLIVENIQVI